MFIPVAYAASEQVVSLVFTLNRLIINPLILLLFAVALVIFVAGVAQFILNQDNDDARAKGRQHIIWGILGIFIMVAVFSIMQLLMNTLGVEGIDPRGGDVRVEDL